MDTLAMFNADPDSYGGSLWLYQSTKGVVALGHRHDSVEKAEAQLREWSELPLEFVPETLTANTAYKARRNVAVVSSTLTGEAVSHAPIADGWFPPGDPRRDP